MRPAESVVIGLGADPQIPALLEAPRVHHRWYLPLKRGVEWVMALFLLVGSSPLLCVLAVLVKATSRGPAFYAQTRLGRSGRGYRILKLRTMCHNAEAHSGPVWAAKDDVRVTALGKFLRDTHLDELPQLWNVLRGEMSLIGPRPERPEIAARISARVPSFYHRLMLPPGVTGLAQMLCPADDPNDADYEGVRRKLAHDLLYIREASPLLDLKIAACTSCYLFVAVVDAVRRRLLGSYSTKIQSLPVLPAMAVEFEQGAA